MREDERDARSRELLRAIKERHGELLGLLDECDGRWGSEDLVYRFYHSSFKLYRIQKLTGKLVAGLRSLLPSVELDTRFEQIINEGTGHLWERSHNDDWLVHTRPQLEAFWHAHYMVAMALRYGHDLEVPPRLLPSGWAAVLTLYGLR